MSVPELLKPASDEEGVDGEGAYVHQFRMRVVFESYLELLSKPHSTGQDIAGRRIPLRKRSSSRTWPVIPVSSAQWHRASRARICRRAGLRNSRAANRMRKNARSLSRMLEGLGVAPPDQVSDAAAARCNANWPRLTRVGIS